jgi:hypothetical protein
MRFFVTMDEQYNREGTYVFLDLFVRAKINRNVSLTLSINRRAG